MEKLASRPRSTSRAPTRATVVALCTTVHTGNDLTSDGRSIPQGQFPVAKSRNIRTHIESYARWAATRRAMASARAAAHHAKKEGG